MAIHCVEGLSLELSQMSPTLTHKGEDFQGTAWKEVHSVAHAIYNYGLTDRLRRQTKK